MSDQSQVPVKPIFAVWILYLCQHSREMQRCTELQEQNKLALRCFKSGSFMNFHELNLSFIYISLIAESSLSELNCANELFFPT